MNQKDTSGAPVGSERSSIGCGLARDQRIAWAGHFRQAFDGGPGLRGRFMVMWLRWADDASRRLGVVASRKSFRRAVARARAKRLLREAFRLNRYRLKSGFDVVLVARYTISDVKRQQVEEDLLAVARRAGILETI